MRYFKIEGVVNIEDFPYSEINKVKLMGIITNKLVETFENLNSTFGGVITEVDKEGNEINYLKE